MLINIEIITENGTGKNINGAIEIDDVLIDMAQHPIDFIAGELKPWIEGILMAEPKGDSSCQK